MRVWSIASNARMRSSKMQTEAYLRQFRAASGEWQVQKLNWRGMRHGTGENVHEDKGQLES